MIELIGKRYGKYIVKGICKQKIGKYIRKVAICMCDCGKEFTRRIDCLEQNVSCGCYNKIKELRHGMSRTPTHICWSSILQRCYNKRTKEYKNYGYRGIMMCERWRDSFENFLADMGPRPSQEHSIDRIDVNGNYEPSNCRWATQKQQCNNRRNTLKTDGIPLSEIYELRTVDIKYSPFTRRLDRGWTIQESLHTPIGEKPERIKNKEKERGTDIIYNGKRYNISEACKLAEIARSTFALVLSREKISHQECFDLLILRKENNGGVDCRLRGRRKN